MGARSSTGLYFRSYRYGLTAIVPLAMSTSVCPSGLARTACCSAIDPPAPGFASTMTGWPSALAMRSAIWRVMASVAPPAA
ncbi:hypothetical protein FQZ97_686560 [compost metagenome]